MSFLNLERWSVRPSRIFMTWHILNILLKRLLCKWISFSPFSVRRCGEPMKIRLGLWNLIGMIVGSYYTGKWYTMCTCKGRVEIFNITASRGGHLPKAQHDQIFSVGTNLFKPFKSIMRRVIVEIQQGVVGGGMSNFKVGQVHMNVLQHSLRVHLILHPCHFFPNYCGKGKIERER